jgi:hypothetical protein
VAENDRYLIGVDSATLSDAPSWSEQNVYGQS